MAVLEAVKGWEFWRGGDDLDLEIENIIDEVAAEERESKAEVEAAAGEGAGADAGQSSSIVEDLSDPQIIAEVESLLNTDYELLLLEHEKHVSTPPSGTSRAFSILVLLLLS